MRFSGWQRDKVIRLFKNGFNSYEGKVHEKIITDGEIGFLKEKLNHYSYKNYNQYQRKLNHYAALRAKQLNEQGKKVNAYHVLIKPPARFVIHYFIRLGFLDGGAGYVFAKTQAYGVLARFIKLWLLNKGINRNRKLVVFFIKVIIFYCSIYFESK